MSHEDIQDEYIVKRNFVHVVLPSSLHCIVQGAIAREIVGGRAAYDCITAFESLTKISRSS